MKLPLFRQPISSNILYFYTRNVIIDTDQCIVIGGAYSVDKFYRLKMGYKWWQDEQPSPAIKEYVEQQVKNHSVDVFFTYMSDQIYPDRVLSTRY